MYTPKSTCVNSSLFRNKRDPMCRYYLAPVREVLSVDGVPARVTNNCLEAVNHYLQEEVGNQKVPWEMAILGLSRYVDQKFGQISGAPFGHGEYRLKLA